MKQIIRQWLCGLSAAVISLPCMALNLAHQLEQPSEATAAVTLLEPAVVGEPATTARPLPIKAALQENFYQAPEAVYAAVAKPVAPAARPPLLDTEAAAAKVDSLTVAHALEVVWRDNPSVQEAEKSIEAAGYEVKGSYGGFLPSLSVSNSTGKNALSSVLASLPLWNGGLTLAQIDNSKAREVLARASLDKVRLTLATQTLTAFYTLAQAQEQLRQWSRYLAALQRLNATVSNRAKQGVAPQSEVQTAVSRIHQAEVGQEAARLQLFNSRTELTKLLNLTTETVQWRENVAAELEQVIAIDNNTIIERNPDVMIAAAQVAEQSAAQRQAKAQLYPEIAVQYRHYYSGQAFDRTADSPQLVVQYQVGNSYTAYQRVSSEQSKLESSRAHLEVAKREAQSALNANRQQVVSSGRQLQLQQLATANTQALVDSFLRQYQVGRRSWIEVLNAQREAHENQLSSIASRRAYALTGQTLMLQSMVWDTLLRDQPQAAGSASGASTAVSP